MDDSSAAPILDHPLGEASVFTAEALIEDVRRLGEGVAGLDRHRRGVHEIADQDGFGHGVPRECLAVIGTLDRRRRPRLSAAYAAGVPRTRRRAR